MMVFYLIWVKALGPEGVKSITIMRGDLQTQGVKVMASTINLNSSPLS